MKVLCIAAVILLAGVVGVFFWWQGKQGTPEYSLALMAEAARGGDTAAAGEFIDSAAVAESLSEQVASRLSGTLPFNLGQAARRQAEGLKPALTPLLRPLVEAEIISQVKEMSEGTEGKPFFLVVVGVSNAATIRREGDDTARVSIKSGEATTEFGMRRVGGRWKIAAVKDETLAARLAAKTAGRLPEALHTVGGGLLNLLPGAGHQR